MSENTFLRLGNGNGASQPMGDPSMGMNPMGGGASSMPMGGPNAMGGDPSMMGGGMPQMGGQDMSGGMPPAGDPSMMGSDPNAMNNGQDMGGGMDQGNEGFDMGIGMNPDEDPKKWLQGAATKVASELRSYQKDLPSPDMEVNKTVVNTIAAATRDNIDDGQKNELMKSYADTMRNNEDGSDGDDSSDDFGGDTNGQEPDMSMDGGQGDMGGDQSMMGGDPNAMGGDQSAQQMMESFTSKIVAEMISDISKKETKKPSDKVKHKEDSRTGYSFGPYTVKPGNNK